MTMEKKLFVVAVVAMMAAVTVYAQEANKVDGLDYKLFFMFLLGKQSEKYCRII